MFQCSMSLNSAGVAEVELEGCFASTMAQSDWSACNKR